MKKNHSLLVMLLLFAVTIAKAQQPAHNKGKFVEYKPGFYENSILKGVEEFEETKNLWKIMSITEKF